MILTGDHDGRIIALVMRDLAAKLDGQLTGVSLIIELTGLAGGCWRIGPAETPAATLHIPGYFLPFQ